MTPYFRPPGRSGRHNFAPPDTPPAGNFHSDGRKFIKGPGPRAGERSLGRAQNDHNFFPPRRLRSRSYAHSTQSVHRLLPQESSHMWFACDTRQRVATHTQTWTWTNDRYSTAPSPPTLHPLHPLHPSVYPHDLPPLGARRLLASRLGWHTTSTS